MDSLSHRPLAVSVLALLVFFTLSLEAVVAKTPTADEGMHMLRGQVLRQTDELGLQGQHTPLSHWLISTFFFAEPTAPRVTDLPSWKTQAPESLVQEFLWSGDVNVSRLLFLGRLPVVFAGLLLGALLSRWARLLADFTGSIIALTLYAFAPNLLASAALATTDMVATVAYFSAAFGVWYYWRRPSAARWLLAGLTLGLAISSKLSGLLILPMAFILSYSESWRRPGGRSWSKPGLRFLSWLPVAALVLWAAYSFEVGQVAELPVPLPAATFLSNFVEVQEHIERGHYSFLLGQRSNEGWWAYFGLAYVYKTPVVVIVLLVVAVIYVSWKRLWRQTTALWLPAGALFLAASASRLNIGFRHILPVAPFLWLLVAMTGPMWRRHRAGRWFLAATMIIYAIGAVRQSPHFLAYFSELIGGSAHGYQYLGDSNIDWGQDLDLLADYAREYEGDSLRISYFGPSDPAYYGLDAPPLFDETGKPNGLSPANPAPGRYAISVNHLQGATPAEPDLFDWFRRQEPADQLGYSILLYDVEEQQEGDWIAHCLDPVPALDEPTAEMLVDRGKLRHLYFDCRQSWVLPGGDDSGWYIVPLDVEPNAIEPSLGENLTLTFRNEAAGYKFYHHTASGEPEAGQTASRSEFFTLVDGSPVELPVAVDGLANLVGGFVNGALWGSIWETEAGSGSPVSVMMHLYHGEPAMGDSSPLVGDGLGFVASQWQPGDLFIQYHDFGQEDGLFLETGLYDFTTGERMPFLVAGAAEPVIRIYP